MADHAQDEGAPLSKWQLLRQELIEEGRGELVELIDQLIQTSHREETARLLEKVTFRLDGNLRL